MSTITTVKNTASSAPPPPPSKPKKNLAIHLFAGGVAGCCEALTCHPLDTIKVRLQLRGERQNKIKQSVVRNNVQSANLSGNAAILQQQNTINTVKKQGNFINVGYNIMKNEGFLSLYKGLGAVVTGIVPKMAIRFSSFEYYKGWFTDPATNVTSNYGNFVAGLFAGTTEAVLVVTPMDVIKIRLQAQRHSMSDPLDIPKYRNAAHCAYVMIKEEGFQSLYKGVALTALRQATNQAANFSVYQFIKAELHKRQPNTETLPAYQHLIVGFISGACGPLFNAPIDTIKTRIQKSPSPLRGYERFMEVTKQIWADGGLKAFYRGLTPRVLRVAPGQAITFMVYERVYKWMLEVRNSMKVDENDFDSSN